MRSVVVHAHFYQPPRENPFFDEIEAEASAAPDHDWNERIERECYRTVVAARVTGDGGRIERIINTLERISFNVGPTLFTWMERHAPDTCRAILAADRASVARLDGHGNAVAHPYHHVILPLATRRDKTTEVRWGIADFRRRFGREPEGMWLPETAVDDETLDVLAEEGIRFTILAPYQVRERPPDGAPGLYRTANGRTIALFLYDGDLSHGVAFGGLVKDAGRFADAVMLAGDGRRAGARQERADGDGSSAAAGARSRRTRGSTPKHAVPIPHSPLPIPVPPLSSLATDGETYGHHHKFAEMALARMLELVEERGARVENYASYLARHPATFEVELVAPSAWSCAHGVERWRSDCSCRMDGGRNPSQAWRAPLREGLDALRDALHERFEREGSALFVDPWRARDAYGAVVSDDDERALGEFVERWMKPQSAPGGIVRARELLEMERDTLRMFTSCAWFFDDVGGLEPKQVLRYAARSLALSGDDGALERALVGTLATARSNDPSVGTGADVYRALTAPPSAEARAAAAARAVVSRGLRADATVPTSMRAVVEGDDVTVESRRTGAERRFTVRAESRGETDVVCTVTARDAENGGDAPSIGIALHDFPERARHAIRDAMRRALLPRFLSTEELDQVEIGALTLQRVVATALTRAVSRLRDDASDDALGRAHAMLDFFEQLERAIPFDAQTQFWHAWTASPAARRAALAPFGARLGFSPTLLGAPLESVPAR